jgi:hypothetical protein
MYLEKIHGNPTNSFGHPNGCQLGIRLGGQMYSLNY